MERNLEKRARNLEKIIWDSPGVMCDPHPCPAKLDIANLYILTMYDGIRIQEANTA